LEITTTRFGEIQVEEDKIIDFPHGILGFSQARQFILFPHKENSPFVWLQSIEDGSLAFVLIQPNLVMPEYHVEVEKTALDELNVQNTSSLEVLCIVTVPRNRPEDMTVNLLGPIVINPDKRLAKQLVITKGGYSHRHPIVT